MLTLFLVALWVDWAQQVDFAWGLTCGSNRKSTMEIVATEGSTGFLISK